VVWVANNSPVSIGVRGFEPLHITSLQRSAPSECSACLHCLYIGELPTTEVKNSLQTNGSLSGRVFHGVGIASPPPGKSACAKPLKEMQ